MDNQDQGLEDHVCSKCGYPCPSSEQRCAHKNICGTIEGPNSLDSGNNENVNVGTREILSRSVDEVFLDANASFSDGAPSPGSMEEPLRDRFDSATHVEIDNEKYQEFSRSSDFNDVNQLTVKSTDDGQMQDPSILQRERAMEGKMLELQRQLSGSQVDPPSSSSITDFRTIEHIDDYFDLSSDSNPSKAEATPDMLLENKIHAGENARPCSLASVANDTNLKENDEIKSESDMFDIPIFSDNIVSGTREGILKIAVSDVVNSDSQVATRAFNLEEKNNAVLLSVMPQEELSLGVNSTILTRTNTSTNGVQVKSAHIIQLATSGVMTMQEMEEKNLNMFTSSVGDDRADVAHPQNECADFEDHKAVLPQNSLSLPSYETGKLKQDDFKDSDDEDNNILINQSHLSEKRELLPSDGRVLDSSMEELESWEFVDEEMHAEESIDVSSVKFMTESDKTSDEIGASMNRMTYVMIENYMSPFSEKLSTSNAVYKIDDVVEMDKSEKCDITDSQYTERAIVENPLLPRPAGSNETDRSCRVNRECNRSISSSAESHQTQNAELLVKAAEEPGRNDSSLHSLNVEPTPQFSSVVGETQVSGLPSSLKEPRAASEIQQCEKPEMIDPPSLMTLVEPGLEKGLNQQHPSSTSPQAGWFIILTREREKNEEIIAEKNEEIIAEKITDNRSSKQNKHVQKSPLREAANSNEPESPKLEEGSIFGESGADKGVKGEGENGSNSSAEMKRQNNKVKSKSYWTTFTTCCSCFDSHRNRIFR